MPMTQAPIRILLADDHTVMRNGLRLLLGSEKDLAQKLALVDPILSQVVGKQRRVAAIDLRAPATPVIVYR